MKKTDTSPEISPDQHAHSFRLLSYGLLLIGFLAPTNAFSQTAAGTFTLSPLSAPGLVLEAVDGGTTEGTVVSLGKPGDEAKQKWEFVAKGDNLYVVRPSYQSGLAMAVAGGKSDNGTPIVLSNENGSATQLWSLKKHENGSFSLLPQFASKKALDDREGGHVPGALQDIWDYDVDDQHLQWTLKPLKGSQMPSLAESDDDDANPGVPHGTVKKFSFNSSKIYPGTNRGVAVFIPQQYDGSKPACVYVQQDGYDRRKKAMLEQLIAAKEMPAAIGIFITSGDLPPSMKGAAGRRNRCYEYDGLGDNYVRFLTEELLPYVAKTYDLKLSTNGNDRCIVGVSSGGIAAFNAAWEKPEAFSRVYAGSGSFTAFRGGNEFPTLVRKYEAKPIRAYLTTGTQDMENCAGDWFLLDQEMDKALRFSGYDYSFHVTNGGHGVGWNTDLPDAMRFLWKGWPQPIAAGPSAPRVRDIITPEGNWELASRDYRDTRSPACNSKGEIFFVDVIENKLYRIGVGGQVQVFLQDAARANGIAVGPKDEIYTVSSATGNVMSYDGAGQGHVLIGGVPAQYVLARPDGTLYVTTPEAQGVTGSQVWMIKDGKKTLVDSGLESAAGLAVRPDHSEEAGHPDGWLLSVADSHSKWIYSYEMKSDGALANKERFFHLQVLDANDDAGPESVCYAKEGQMLVGTRAGIQVCADDGPTQVILPMPDHQRVMGVALGGPALNILYAFCGGEVWKRTVKIHAVGAFSPTKTASTTPL